MKRLYPIVCFCLALCLMTPVLAQEALTYQKPPKEIEDLFNAPLTPLVSIDSKGSMMLFMERADYPSIAELSQPELRLAGLRINPATNGQSRTSHYIGLKLRKLLGKEDIAIKGLPENPLISNVQWSPDESKIAFTNTTASEIQLWVIDVATAQAKKVTDLAMNDAYYGSPFEWLADNNTFICRTVAQGRGKAPEPNRVPTGPTVQENLGKKAPAMTFQDLLKNSYDEALFDYYCTSQVMKISLDGKVGKIGNAGVIQSANASPDGKYIMIKTTHRPYSYLVPAGRFPLKVDLYDINGNFVKTLVDNPLLDNIPSGFDAVQTGQRNHAWRSDAPATLYWVEAQDGGDPKKEVKIRDKVFTLDAPFNGTPSELYASTYRFGGFTWGNANLAFASEYWRATRKSITKIINPSAKTEPVVLFDRSSEDRYNNPGSPELKKNQYGKYVLDISKDNSIVLFGQGASPEGDRPFVDILNLTTKQTKRLWRSEAPYFERPVAVLNLEQQQILTTRESQTENPNYFIRSLKAKKNNLAQITFFPHPYPQLKDVSRQVLKYKRNDGVDLTAELYLPAGYTKEQGALPTFLWAYPVEYKSKDAAGQVSGSPYQFTRLNWGTPLFWVTQGYAILNNATIPIVGEGNQQPNDTYVEQLVASAKAAIDEGVRLGVVDPKRVAAGGHSYGAFMTANLLTHSNLFRAGIARSGAYNRTLTPFGFQNEERTYWEAPQVYNAMSPFMNAHKMNEPLLLIHGEADNNTGTFPIQSERYFNALRGLGATVRYVSLPYESHGYAAKESIMHTLWEMHQWLEKYVKNAKTSE
ncbi:S9 family peptidase [Thermoflexibacter ruber]|uniref:Dipeptidyl aminopeptidase/acylaminoacyl peptidase n=1 Tax=Thermoflexibacter ruber TaxID=1003 RepID=A0A1I2ENS8_9BACT|nr:prolyl oligopeptidase family serine peptidase [Thermoflexibacter ruber]SFE94088.1 Dipeptidyl aminopeptidase/acylaminoacyl peptidase [Thermoflexibacter ruber]